MDQQSNNIQAKKAALAFSRILAHISARLDVLNQDASLQQERDMMPQTLMELSLAFEQKGGFMFSKEQSLPLAYALELVHQACNNLAKQAKDVTNSHDNQASQTFIWAAAQAALMRDVLEQKHKQDEGGIISFDADMQTKLIQSLGGTPSLENSDEGDTHV